MKYISAKYSHHTYIPLYFPLSLSPQEGKEVSGQKQNEDFQLTENKVGDVQSAKVRPFRGGELRPGAVFDDTDGGREGCLKGEEQEAEMERWICYCN